MKYVKEVMWIIIFTFAGELLHAMLPLPVPSGVYGLVLLLLALCSGRLRTEDVDCAGSFLLDTMTMMFIPAAVGIMTVTEVLRPVLLPYLVIIALSTVLVMGVTGICAEHILRRGSGKRKEEA